MGGYHKDFDGWNERKKRLDKSRPDLYFKEREIWWCSTGINVGHEQDGKGPHFWRPVVVVKKFNEHLFQGVPLTSKTKVGRYYMSAGIILERKATAVLSQTRPFSTKRLIHKIGMIDEDLFLQMKKATVEHIFGDFSLSPSAVELSAVVSEGEAEAHFFFSPSRKPRR